MKKQLTTLALVIVLPVVASTCALPASAPDSFGPPSSGGPALPVRTLRHVSIDNPVLLDDYPPSGWRVAPGRNGAVIRPDGRIVLRGTPERPIYKVRRAPQDGHLLIHHGDGSFRIYDASGTFVSDVPEIHHLFADAGMATWRWRTPRTLIGVTELSPPVRRPMYPDGDVLPESTLLFLHEPYGDPETVHLLQTPEPPAGTVIRLEGVTAEGALLLGIVEPEQYFGGPPTKIIGLFEVDRL